MSNTILFVLVETLFDLLVCHIRKIGSFLVCRIENRF